VIWTGFMWLDVRTSVSLL